MTLLGNLAAQLVDRPSAEVCRLLDAEGAARSVTVEALLRRAMAFAAHFGRPRGERQIVAVCLYHGADLHAAFLGALWAGHLPTMIAPPSPRMEPQKYTSSFCQMLEHIRPAFVVADHGTIARLDALALASFPGSKVIDPDTVTDAGLIDPHPARPDEVALLQHSSGTTGLQKGVALSHRAVLDHNRVYAERIQLRRDDVIASWLPLYHDMGFIACFLLPLLGLRGVVAVERLLGLVHRLAGLLQRLLVLVGRQPRRLAVQQLLPRGQPPQRFLLPLLPFQAGLLLCLLTDLPRLLGQLPLPLGQLLG